MIDQVIHGDCLEVMRGMPDYSVDACVVDPPYGFGEVKDIAGLLHAWMQDEDDIRYLGKGGFMGKEWDSGVPGPRYWREVYRVLKPGAHILAFSSTRTYDLLVIALRLANFQIKDTIIWCHGQGFPKSLNLGNGRGTALKPALEPICLARKPLSEKSISENVLKWGCGGINVDGCRVNPGEQVPGGGGSWGRSSGAHEGWKRQAHEQYENSQPHTQGRFPSHLLLSHSPECILRGTKRVHANRWGKGNARYGTDGTSLFFGEHASNEGAGYADEHGQEEVQDFECVEGCPIRQLDLQGGIRKNGGQNYETDVKHTSMFGNAETSLTRFAGDEGGPSRYFTQLYDASEPVEWICHPSCPVRVLGEQSGECKSGGRTHRAGDVKVYKNSYRDGTGVNQQDYQLEQSEGTAARYFTQLHDPLAELDAPFHYFSKASRRERNQGCEDIPAQYNDFQRASCGLSRSSHDKDGHLGTRSSPSSNHHPTVKPVSLMSWLCRLITPPGGILLDPFLGSGSTAVAAIQEGFHFIGIEAEEEYCRIAEARIHHAMQEVAKRAESEEQEWICHPSCPIRVLGEQAGESKSRVQVKAHAGEAKFNGKYNHGEIYTNQVDQVGGHNDEGSRARYFTQLPPDPVSLWDLLAEDE